MLDTIFGLPVHPLIVHATVVLVPLAAVSVLLASLWPRFRAWAGWGPAALSVVAVVLAPLSTSSGESFEERLGGGSKLIEEHSELGDMLLWWVVPLAVLAVGAWLLRRTGRLGERRPLALVVTVLSVVAAVGTLVMVVLIGHSGAKAAWSGVGSASGEISRTAQPR